jgi:hypothetical protein
MRRYLCSELVTLRENSRDSVVNLEEIWETGATIESEDAVEEGAAVEIRCDAALFTGRTTRIDRHAHGWTVEIEFSPETPWSLEKFRPRHLLDASTLRHKSGA